MLTELTAAVMGKRGERVSVPVEAVTHLLSDCKYTEAHHPGGVLLLAESLKGIVEARPDLFLLCHRGAAVARRLITGFQRENWEEPPYGCARVQLEGVAEPVKVSRRCEAAVKEQLKTNLA